MKKRLGFVSNSSSSSFTCDISGQTESGYDMCLSDAEMVESKWGTYCERYLLKPFEEICQQPTEEFIKACPGYSEEDLLEAWQYDLRDSIPDKYCPLFNLKNITNDVLIKYLFKSSGKTREQICDEIRSKFKNLKELKEYNENKK
jgi:hypothetical protein